MVVLEMLCNRYYRKWSGLFLNNSDKLEQSGFVAQLTVRYVFLVLIMTNNSENKVLLYNGILS